jgi:hypothetical protein
VLFLAFFGTLWASLGINGLKNIGEPWLVIAVWAIGLALLIAGASLSHVARQASAKNVKERQHIMKWFRIIFAFELIAIAIAAVICRAVNRFDLFFPVMMLIVGIHFFPMASLFKIRKYYWTGAFLCLLAIFTFLTVPLDIQYNGTQIHTQRVILGFGGAFVIWGVGLANWLQGKSLLAQRKR